METTKELIFLFIGLATGIFLSIDLKRGCPRCGARGAGLPTPVTRSVTVSSATAADMRSSPSFRSVRSAFLRSGYEVRVLAPPEIRRLDGYRSRTHGGTVLGLVVPDRNLIAVSSSQSLAERTETLIHEMVHVFDDSMDEAAVERAGNSLFLCLTKKQRTFLELFL